GAGEEKRDGKETEGAGRRGGRQGRSESAGEDDSRFGATDLAGRSRCLLEGAGRRRKGVRGAGEGRAEPATAHPCRHRRAPRGGGPEDDPGGRRPVEAGDRVVGPPRAGVRGSGLARAAAAWRSDQPRDRGALRASRRAERSGAIDDGRRGEGAGPPVRGEGGEGDEGDEGARKHAVRARKSPPRYGERAGKGREHAGEGAQHRGGSRRTRPRQVRRRRPKHLLRTGDRSRTERWRRIATERCGRDGSGRIPGGSAWPSPGAVSSAPP